MLKKENGVTLVALVITIIVMLILASITIVASTNLTKKSKLKNLQTNMLLIQAKAEEIYNKKEYGEISDFPGEKSGSDYSAACSALNDSEQEYTRHLKKDVQYDGGLEVDSDDFYVNYKTGDVYSAEGYEGEHLLSKLKNY
ncbi:MAG: hypothetical protein IKF52_01595 [Clostridia bacterium]|nr:hypothetical protein [Clostridia bacterium]